MSVMDSITNGLKGVVREKWDEFAHHADDLFAYVAQNLQEHANAFLREMIDFILETPLVTDEPIVHHVWSIVRVISFSLVGLMFTWEGFKLAISGGEVLRTVEFKTMFTRMIIGIVLAAFSLDIIDLIIRFNNALIDMVKVNFPITIQRHLTVSGTFGFVMDLALIITQVIIGIRLILQYWMRLAEIWLMSVLSPIVYVLWINPHWGSYYFQWFHRLTTTIFTTFVWALILAMYSSMISMVASSGTLASFPTLGPIAGMCLSVSMLLMMIETPSFLRRFMDNQPSALGLLRKTSGNIMRSPQVRTARKIKDWIIKRG